MNKSYLFPLFILLMTLSSCNDSLTRDEKQSIKAELADEVADFYTYKQESHVQKLSKIYWDDEEFMTVNDTDFYNYESLMAATAEGVKSVLEFKLDSEHMDYQFIDQNNVLVIVRGRLYVLLTDSTRVTYDPYVCSMLFKKIDKDWKVAYFQQTTEIASSEN